jgi:NADH-quinone oxidoreductase subunit A
MPDNYFARYLPLLIQLGIALALAVGMVILSTLLGKHRYSRAKMSPYECGMTPVGDARERFSVKFYLVAMLFILFDVEAVFLYPWAVLLRELKMFGFWEMLVYIGIVLVGLFYVWNKGVLDWSLAERSGLPSAPAMIPEPADVHGATPALTAPAEGSRS